jgi:cobalt/nickel transport system ATP-binding protein
MSCLLEIDDLSYTYPGGPEALRGITLHLRDGARVALVGPNGAGKSTLLLALVGILPASGTVRVGGVTLGRDTLREVRSRIGLVFQDPNDQLFMPTVDEDVAFGPAQLGLPPDEVRRRTGEALRAVGLEGLGGRSPHPLSGGERRAASLATVLPMEPHVLALDEPTTGLDPR